MLMEVIALWFKDMIFSITKVVALKTYTAKVDA
jgi:hypothetical protein